LLVVAGIGGGLVFWSSEWGAAFGGKIDGERLERLNASPSFVDGKAQNSVETSMGEFSWSDTRDFLVEWYRGRKERKPQFAVPMVTPDAGVFEAIPRSGIRFIWLGHSTVYLEIDGTRVLIDPMWSDRSSPFRHVGPRRSHEMPIALADLPAADVVVISHDHYDHLDMGTVRALAPRGVVFAVPLGVGAHLEAWDVPGEQIIELDWWQSSSVGSLTLVATPARHFSGRWVDDGNSTLWASWTMIGRSSRIFYSGDTGWFDGFERIGREYGPFDLTIMKCGAYGNGWPDIHINGYQAVDAHLLLKGRRLLPVHWLTFDLALHPWEEPVAQVTEAGRAKGIEVVTPRVGELVDLRIGFDSSNWWETTP
jgi:L-ascorbate metabolism protein UlaG (beta-lactamase superfamily)